jgi:hypothetical protein
MCEAAQRGLDRVGDHLLVATDRGQVTQGTGEGDDVTAQIQIHGPTLSIAEADRIGRGGIDES